MCVPLRNTRVCATLMEGKRDVAKLSTADDHTAIRAPQSSATLRAVQLGDLIILIGDKKKDEQQWLVNISIDGLT